MIVQNKKILTTVFAFFISVVCAVAQDKAPPQPQGGMTPHTTPPGLPIDDGLIFLFAAALMYGVYMVLRLSKNSTQA